MRVFFAFSKAVLVLGVGLTLNACALFSDQSKPEETIGPREDVIFANFEDVWRAANIVMQPYPLRLSNMDEGVLETDNLKGYRTWQPPFPQKKTAGLMYRLTVRIVRGSSEGQAATKVIILKDAQVQRDFFSNVQQLPSDGLEEKALFYRIKREVQIERALNYTQKKKGG